MNIVITGANGFAGAALCRYFSGQGHQVIATGRQTRPNAALLNYASYLQADITLPIEEFKADVCIHAAGLASDTADYNTLFLNNVKGTENVLGAAKHCRYLIFISSSSVYDFNARPAVETDATLDAPLSDYGRTKLLAEKLVKSNIPAHQHRMILRPRAIYGVGDRVLLPRLLSLVKWQTIFCPVNRQIQTSATHIKNIAHAVDLFLNQTNTPALQLYNIADDNVYKLREITLKAINAVEGRRLSVLNIPPAALKMIKQLSPIAIKALTENSMLNLGDIKKSLGYQPEYTFENSCAELSEWINAMGGKKVYLENIANAPWMLNLRHNCNENE